MRYFVNKESAAVRVAVGDEILVRLHELATAGYEWHWPDELPPGLQVFTVESSVHSEEAVGGKNLRELGLRALTQGRYILLFQCYRSWEGPSSSIETYTLEVNVQP